MVQRLISFDDEKPDLGLPDDVQARMDARYSTGGGTAPHIGENGNWWIGDTDTGTPAQGPPGTGGGGGGLVPDPDNPGLYIIQAGSSLTPDPENPGLYLIGA